jgi:ubiquinone/menaquinone biosynthesis C-methylase UbiE
MRDEYKQKEIEHYDRLAREWRRRAARGETTYDIEGADVMRMRSYRELYQILAGLVPGRRVLDYGCGHGMHAAAIAKMGAKEVVGIDLSEESLAIARERIKREGLEDKVSFHVMDAEHMTFPEKSFDIVFDGGVFYSIDIKNAYKEIARVLKPGGVLIGIETLGHNPIANFRRRLNVLRGVRTAWAAKHIMKMKDLKDAEQYFTVKEIKFFHLVSFFMLPFVNLPGGLFLVGAADLIDKYLMTLLPILRRYAFKIVFVFEKK